MINRSSIKIQNLQNGEWSTLGGSRLRRTINVWEIMFEKRGPIATYSNNLQFSEIQYWAGERNCQKYAIRLLNRILKGNRYQVTTNLSISSRIMMLIGDLYASSKTCLIHTNLVCQQLKEHENNIYSSLRNTDLDNVSTFCALLKTNHSFSRDLQNSESISHSEKTIVRSEDDLQRKIDTYDLNIWEVTIDTNSCS